MWLAPCSEWPIFRPGLDKKLGPVRLALARRSKSRLAVRHIVRLQDELV
jgi:hypothetical protein